MVIYPIPVEVTQARVQLAVDQAAKAESHTINQDLQAVDHARSDAIEATIANFDSEEPSLVDVKV
jgi:hypothetical protein